MVLHPRCYKRMSEHLSDEHIIAYRGRKLAAADLLSASNHLAACATCRARAATPEELHAGYKAIRAVMDAEAGTLHLTYDEIAAYVDGQLRTEDNARVDLHVRECAACAADLEGIQALRRELETSRAIERSSGRFTAFWQTALSWRGALVLAGAAGCALLVVLLFQKPGQQNLNYRAQVSVPGVSPEARRPVESATIRDGNRLVTIAAGGVVSGLEALPDSDRAAVERVLAAKRVDASAASAVL